MSEKPWNSIAESIVDNKSKNHLRGFAESLESPCLSCSTSPCCTHLPLNTFNVRNLIELDHARYLLNFDRIELGIAANGDWSAYYTYPCRFLDRQSYRCTIHNQPQQPQICANYNPYHCWYKRVFTQSHTDDFIRIDRQRMEFILGLVAFDDDGTLTQIPDWETLTAGIAEPPMEKGRQLPDPTEEDASLKAWKKWVSGAEQDTGKDSATLQKADLQNPCTNCQAYCCTTLVFPQGHPTSLSNLDYYKFCLGFPGVELGVSDAGWSVIVRTKCRHLKDNKCSIYGKPERPLICKYYDEWKCTYKPQFGLARPNGFMRIQLQHFEFLSECFQFDEHGNIVQFPSTEEIRTSVESSFAVFLKENSKMTSV